MAEKNNNNVTYFAETNFRNERKKFGIKRQDRTKHMYIIGKTGMGKTTLLENMAIQDILNNEGVGIVDPHGGLAEKTLNFIPKNRIDDVLYFAPHDIDWPIAFNVMENVDPTQRHLIANGLLGVFKKIWPDVWSPRMEYILNNCILALLEYPDSTLLGINRMLSDRDFRREVVSKIADPVVKAFWTDEFAKYTDRYMTEAGAAIQNKVGQFISNPLIRNIIGQPKSAFDIRDIMDKKKIFIMNLSKGRIGEENSRLIGAMLITKIYLAAMSRVDVPEEERSDFYLYVDEFQNFATESFKDILSEARKYRLNLILAHQYIAQMDESVRDAVFGNVGTFITFRVGAADAEELEKEFAPEFYVQDIVNLGFANIYLRLMIDGVASRPFSAFTLPPVEIKEKINTEKIIETSREKYATAREEVEEKIIKWHEPVASSKDEVKPKETFAVPGIKRSIPHMGHQREKLEFQPELYEAVCAVCGKKTYVPFKPDGIRPTFCKVHRRQVEHEPLPKTISLKELEDPLRRSSNEAGKKRVEPKIDELREVLDEVAKEKESIKKKSGTLKPGDRIKFE
jgi:CxxC-x17-CxxC domain-containing protein